MAGTITTVTNDRHTKEDYGNVGRGRVLLAPCLNLLQVNKFQ